MNVEDMASAGIHPIELCVYSILSSNLEGIYQAINELRESQALLVMKLSQVRTSYQEEQELLKEEGSLKEEAERVLRLRKRVDRLVGVYNKLSARCRAL